MGTEKKHATRNEKPKAHSIYQDDIADGHDDTVMSCNLLNAEKNQIQHIVDDKTG